MQLLLSQCSIVKLVFFSYKLHQHQSFYHDLGIEMISFNLLTNSSHSANQIDVYAAVFIAKGKQRIIPELSLAPSKLMIPKTTISPVCLGSRGLIQLPARGSMCFHYQPFDLQPYDFEINVSNCSQIFEA